ncbi:HAD superfamily hydrolase (TIGR01509 family) [Yoonia maricola]|uniref:phosphoglycolate phosphatase n=1 Tax=Yoonia maricola TaxID=420999 RepID=A0A2M8W5V0_9RHOB|nr:HAD family phosphatase [Yoonia maricola]PJI86297.1 HAD superfamily hydrolase (TIGR01509 family) [Yoonia maricola]
MTLELVIFDCDGMLVDTEAVTNRIIADFLEQYGLTIAEDEIVTLFSGGTMASVGVEATKRGAKLPEGWLDEIYSVVFDALRQGVAVIAGVEDLIDQLMAKGIAIAIASNGPMQKMEITLRPSGLWQRFEGRIYSGHQYAPKPKPDMLYQIMADAGVMPAQTVMIDDMPSGCRAAQAAGVRCFGYVADGDPARLDGTGAIKVWSMAEVADLLRAAS